MQLDDSTRTAWDVRHYGAAGDGATDDTAAIQLAVDRCRAAGGGQVLLPAGSFRSGPISLLSNVQLHLSAGAILVADPVDPVDPVDSAAVPLITARGQDNVSISGAGVIDGAAAPGPLILLDGCRRVRVHEVTLLHSPHGSLGLTGCDDAEVRGVTVTNPAGASTGDGIDVSGSRDVTISDCRIRAGAGALIVRGTDRDSADHLVVDQERTCENVIVGRCQLAAPGQGLRILGGRGTVRNCLFADLVISDSGCGIDIAAGTSGSRTVIENLRFSNLIIDGAAPIAVHAAADGASIRDLVFTGMTITASSGASLTGAVDAPLERIRLSDIDWTIRPAHESAGGNGRAADPALHGLHLADLVVGGVTVRRDGVVGGNGREGFVLEQADGVLVRELSAK
ncbi:glycoside hydrolase family 28 protein [Microlunatus speluncae]|uniref:glycoside hydrolase family 28 protein n=1 Tax=Microlunatus speluncae TaxID=2594267 RepID=UPI001375832E|nr:glycosyl hydrolase family 28-related protein [Microlunatus speluncae]